MTGLLQQVCRFPISLLMSGREECPVTMVRSVTLARSRPPAASINIKFVSEKSYAAPST